MLPGPGSVANLDLADLAVVLIADRNRQPHDTIGGLHPVAIPPVVHGVLHVVVEDENISIAHDVEVAAPRHVVGLDDGGFHFIRSSTCVTPSTAASTRT